MDFLTITPFSIFALASKVFFKQKIAFIASNYMGKEIERKYLLINDDWKSLVSERIIMKQGYLNSNSERTIRIRILEQKGILTIKGKTIGITRSEFEYEVPLSDAYELIKLCEKPIIEKVRNIVKINADTWEIDEFGGKNQGLVLAEIELESEDATINLPKWIGKEVSMDQRYYNSNLAKHPFTSKDF